MPRCARGALPKIIEKLVRDKIPEIISANGGSCKVRVPRSERVKREFADAKLTEEVSEYFAERRKRGHAYQREKVLEELADIYEIIKHLAVLEGFGPDAVFYRALEKRSARGGFDKSYVWTIEKRKKARKK